MIRQVQHQVCRTGKFPLRHLLFHGPDQEATEFGAQLFTPLHEVQGRAQAPVVCLGKLPFPCKPLPRAS